MFILTSLPPRVSVPRVSENVYNAVAPLTGELLSTNAYSKGAGVAKKFSPYLL